MVLKSEQIRMFKGNVCWSLLVALLKHLNLPSEEQNKVQPSKEQSQSSQFLLVTEFTVTGWNNVEESHDIPGPIPDS